MSKAAILLSSLALSFATAATTVYVVTGGGSSPIQGAGSIGPASAEVAALQDQIAALEERIQSMEGQPAIRSSQGGVDPELVAAAVRDWLEQHGEGSVQSLLAGGAANSTAVTTESLLAELAAGGHDEERLADIWGRAKAAGLLEEMIDIFAQRAAANPNDPDAQSDLGGAYLNALQHLDNQMEQGQFATKADAAFDAALEIDDHHWGARFQKAIALSFWPAFMGRRPESIQNFETLIQQQEAGPLRPEGAMTYLFLGNMYAEAGDAEKARATWERGSRYHPDSADLKARMTKK